jgi:hypothetical protein
LALIPARREHLVWVLPVEHIQVPATAAVVVAARQPSAPIPSRQQAVALVALEQAAHCKLVLHKRMQVVAVVAQQQVQQEQAVLVVARPAALAI